MKRSSRLRRLLLLIAVVVCVTGAALAVLDWRGRRTDQLARASAEENTSHYHQLFALGEPQRSIEEALALQRLYTLRRGSEILVIAKEGHSVWYCNHNFFGTALSFANGKLDAIKTDEWLEICL